MYYQWRGVLTNKIGLQPLKKEEEKEEEEEERKKMEGRNASNDGLTNE